LAQHGIFDDNLAGTAGSGRSGRSGEITWMGSNNGGSKWDICSISGVSVFWVEMLVEWDIVFVQRTPVNGCSGVGGVGVWDDVPH